MKDLRIPSDSVLSRYRIVLDCAFMMWMRDRHRSSGSQVARCLLTDSSPQGLENWQITECFCVTDVVDIGCAVDILTDLLWSFSCDDDELGNAGMDRAENEERYKQLSREVAEGIHHHVLPPTALGFRKASYVHKLNAVLHSIYNESSDYRDCSTE